MKFALALIFALPAFGAPMLASNPLAYNKLYLDADTVPWTASDDTITQVWKLVVDAYKPFNVDVTTIDPGPRPDVAWLVIGGPGPGNGVRGSSVIGNWTWGTQFKPYGTAFAGFAYPDGLSITETADVLAHEPGHLFGLPHSTDDIMYPYVQPIPTTAPWDAANLAFLADQLGVFQPPDVAPDTAEPGVLLLIGMVYLASRRHHRHQNGRPASSGTSQTDSISTPANIRVAPRMAASRSVASTCSSNTWRKSPHTSIRVPLTR